jgi:hypothetical protein
VHQLVDKKNFGNTKMHGVYVKKNQVIAVIRV